MMEKTGTADDHDGLDELKEKIGRTRQSGAANFCFPMVLCARSCGFRQKKNQDMSNNGPVTHR